MSTTLTIQPAEATAVDTWIDSANPTTANGTDTVLKIGNPYSGSVDSHRRALLRFDLSNLPRGAIVSTVILTLHTNASNLPGPGTWHAYRLTETAWTESATWNTKDGAMAWTSAGGDYTTTNGCAFTPSAGGLSLDVKAMLLDAVQAALTALDVIVLEADAGAASTFDADSSGAVSSNNRPKLQIVYTHGGYGIEAMQIMPGGLELCAGEVIPL